MRIFRYELYKIYSRKILTIAFSVFLLITFIYTWQNIVGGEGVMEDGVMYVRKAAIRKDKEIAAQYEGSMTIAKAQDILAQYGYPPDMGELDIQILETTQVEGGRTTTFSGADGLYDNFCNRFVKECLSDWRYGQLTDKEGYDLVSAEENPAYYMGNNYFGYAGGWKEYCGDLYMIIIVLANLLIIIAVSPVFAEEYSLKTAATLLTAEHGKAKGIQAKICAAFCYGAVVYTLMVGINILFLLGQYGTEGLRVSAVYAGVDLFRGTAQASMTVGGYLLFSYAMGLVGILMNVAIVLAFSAVCRQPFSAVISAAACYITPWFLCEVILNNLRPSRLLMHITSLLQSFPFYLPYSGGEFLAVNIPVYWKLTKLCIITAVFVICIGQGYRKYKHHQI